MTLEWKIDRVWRDADPAGPLRRRRIRALAGTLALALLIACRAAPPPAQEKTVTLEDPMQKVLSRFLRLLAETPANEFRPLPTGRRLADRAYFASLDWCGRVS